MIDSCASFSRGGAGGGGRGERKNHAFHIPKLYRRTPFCTQVIVDKDWSGEIGRAILKGLGQKMYRSVVGHSYIDQGLNRVTACF